MTDERIAKQNKKRRAYVKRKLKRHPPFGSEFILYGSIIILMWALGELNASYTFIVAWFKVDKRLIDLGYITFREYFFEILLKTPEAVAAIKQLLVLCLGVFMGLIGILFRKRKISIPMMLTAVILSTFEVAEPFWMRLTDYTRYVKLAGCVFLFVGGICKIATWAAKRYRFGSEFDRKQRKKAIRKGSDRRDKTLIPQRITKYGYMERR